MNRSIGSDSEFYLDKNLEGAAMRDQLTVFYNKLAYWTAIASQHDAERKVLQSLFERVRDEAKCNRALVSKQAGLKSAAQDAFIRNFWKETIEVDGEETTPIEIQERLNEAIERDNESRHNMSVCQYAVDICRSLLSWDKMELSQIGAA